MTEAGSQDLPSGGEQKQLSPCYPKWCGKPVYDGNKEAVGWTLVSIAFAINYIGVGAFFATTILQVAEGALQCNKALAAGLREEECPPAITSVKVSSLFTLYVTLISVVTALFLPVFGAIVDHTSHRLLIGRIAAGVYTVLIFPLIFLSQQNYIIILGIHGCSVFVGWFVQTIWWAYLPELTQDELKLAYWTKCISMWTYAVMFLYLVLIIGGIQLAGKNGQGLYVCQVAMSVMFGLNATFLQVSFWFLFEERKPLHEMPEGSSLCSVGFKQLYNTGCHVVKNYRSLKWYYLHIFLGNSGWQAFGVISLTYITDVIQLNNLQVGIAFACFLIASLPGAMVGTALSRILDPIRSSEINGVFLIIFVAVFVLVLYEPGQQVATYCVFAFFGFCGGWKVTMDRLISSSIIPTGQDTEMMGFFLFIDQSLLWLPLVTFTILNESNVSPRISVASMEVYLCISLFFLFMTGGYSKARQEVNRDSVYFQASEGTTEGHAENKEHGEIEANGKSNPPVVDPVAEEGAAIIAEA